MQYHLEHTERFERMPVVHMHRNIFCTRNMYTFNCVYHASVYVCVCELYECMMHCLSGFGHWQLDSYVKTMSAIDFEALLSINALTLPARRSDNEAVCLVADMGDPINLMGEYARLDEAEDELDGEFCDQFDGEHVSEDGADDDGGCGDEHISEEQAEDDTGLELDDDYGGAGDTSLLSQDIMNALDHISKKQRVEKKSARIAPLNAADLFDWPKFLKAGLEHNSFGIDFSENLKRHACKGIHLTKREKANKGPIAS